MPTSNPSIYIIELEGCLTGSWSEWFEGMEVQVDSNGTTRLLGPLNDQAALLGVLNKVQALNLTLISVTVQNRENG